MRFVFTISAASLATAGSLACFGPLGTAYGALCAVCFICALRDPEWRWVGAALAVSWFISNLICTVGAPADRAPVYSGAEIFVILSAFTCWFGGRYVAAARILAVVSFISIACNVIFAASSCQWSDINAHEVRTNIAFAIECLIVGVVGALERGYFDHLLNRRGGSVANHVSVQKASER